MSDTKSGDDKTLSVTPKNTSTLTLKRPAAPGQSTVRQNFSHGRTNTVVVETKRKFQRPGERPEPVVEVKPKAPAPVQAPAPTPAPVPAVQARREPAPVNPAPASPPPVSPASTKPAPASQASAPPPAPAPQPRREPPRSAPNDLSSREQEARLRALRGAAAREQEDRARLAADAKRRAEEEERRKRERDDSARRQAEEEARIKAEAESRRRAEEDARRRLPQTETAGDDDEAPARRTSGGAALRGAPVRRVAVADVARPSRGRGEADRRQGRLTVASVTSSEDGSSERGRSLAAARRRQEKFKRAMHQEPREKIAREVVLPETITIQELASACRSARSISSSSS
jgi:translation initiation factor IF-2